MTFLSRLIDVATRCLLNIEHGASRIFLFYFIPHSLPFSSFFSSSSPLVSAVSS